MTSALNAHVFIGDANISVLNGIWPTGVEFNIQIDDEVMLVTAIRNTSLYHADGPYDFIVTRAQNGTTAAAHNVASLVSLVITDTSVDNIIVLPDQVSNSGKFLTTDGVNIIWGNIPGGGDILESQVTSLVTDLAAKAALDSPHLIGVPTTPTAAFNDSSSKIANTTFVQNQHYQRIPAIQYSTSASITPLSNTVLILDTTANAITVNLSNGAPFPVEGDIIIVRIATFVHDVTISINLSNASFDIDGNVGTMTLNALKPNVKLQYIDSLAVWVEIG